jgi:hypothetical protein
LMSQACAGNDMRARTANATRVFMDATHYG